MTIYRLFNPKNLISLDFTLLSAPPEISWIHDKMAGLSLSASRKLFAALLTLPLAAAFSSTSLLFLPGAPWSQDQRLVSSMGQVFLPPIPNKTYKKKIREILFTFLGRTQQQQHGQ